MWFAGIVILLMSNYVRGQTITKPEIWQVNRFGQEHGLLQLNVKDMALDSLGFLWVGTEDGLHRFNGYEFKSYVHNPKDNNSLIDDHVRGVLSHRSKLWLATSAKGITVYSPADNHFSSPLKQFHSNDYNTTFRILQCNEDELLFSVQNHAILYNTIDSSQQIIPLPVNDKLSYVNDLLYVDDDKYWLATSATGIVEMNIKTLEIKQLPFLQNFIVNAFYKKDNIIVIGTETGVFVYYMDKNKLIGTTINYPTNCFYNRNQEELFAGTDNGLLYFNFISNKLTPIILKVNESHIYETVDINRIVGDNKGNIWIGTEGDGLIYYNSYKEKFKTVDIQLKEYPLKADISTFQILKLNDDNILLGTKHGIVNYNPLLNRFNLYPSTRDMLIYTIKKDFLGNVWAGGFTTGLLKYNPVGNSFTKIEPEGIDFSDNDIIEIISVDDVTLWIATWSGGMYSYNINTNFLEKLLFNGMEINKVRCSFTDSEGNIWLGSDDGVLKFEKNQTLVHYTTETECKLSGNRVFAINEDKNGNIWIGTNVGLTKIEPQNIISTVYYKQKGLPNDFIYSILIDNSNDIWISTNYGISVLYQETGIFRNFSASDGLQHNEFNGKAGYKDELGLFYFAGISGLNIFNPGEIVENPFIPNVYIESVELFNQELNQNELYKKHLRFKSKENVLTFKFSSLNYLNPEKCDYQYQMVGFDNEWRPVTKIRSTTYTNLDPGEYTFKVKASNDAGNWNTNPAEMKITIVPPWFETTFFKTVFFIVFLMSGIIYYLYQTRKLKRDKLKLERIVLHRTKQIQEKNKKLELAFSEAKKQSDSITFLMKELRHRVKNNLQIISSLLNIQSNLVDDQSAVEALKMAKNRIVAITQIERKISEENENIDIGTFIKEISEGITGVMAGEELLKYKLNLNLCSARMKKLNTTLIGLILNELITNTTKYAFDYYEEKNRLNIGCAISENTLMLTVTDNGKGYDPARIRKNSLGLVLVNDMVGQLGGTLKVENYNGTKNTIEIPI